MTNLKQREEKLKKEIKGINLFSERWFKVYGELKGIQFAQKAQAEKIEELKEWVYDLELGLFSSEQRHSLWDKIGKVFGSDEVKK
jgi:hypothetical protein